MNFIEILPFLIVIIGLIINLIFGVMYKTEFTVLMVKSIILTISLSVCGIYASDILRIKHKNNRNSKSSIFEAQVPSMTVQEFKNLNNIEEEFQAVNPASLYNKNNALK